MRKKSVAVLLAACLGLCGCSWQASADGGQTAFTVNGEAVAYREWNFYLRMNQMQWERGSLDTYGDGMWSMQMEEDGGTLADKLKEEVFDTIVQLHLAVQHAKEYGVALDEKSREDIRQRAADFMGAYNRELLAFAGAQEEYVYERLCDRELADLVEEAATAGLAPDLSEEDIHREGICYVLISTTGIWDKDGNLDPFTEEEKEQKARLAQELCEAARESKNLEAEADERGLMPVVSSMGMQGGQDGRDPRLLEAARALAVGEISDPVWTEDGWFIVQHTNDYDEEGSAYWQEHLTELFRQEEYGRISAEWLESADIVKNPEVMDQAEVKIVLKELL